MVVAREPPPSLPHCARSCGQAVILKMPSEADRRPPAFAVGERVRVEFGTATGKLGSVLRVFPDATRPERDLVVVQLAETDGCVMTVSVYPHDLRRELMN